MKVYLVEFSVQHEGCDVYGIYSTEAKARAYIEEIIADEKKHRNRIYYPDMEGCWRCGDLAYTITEHEVE